MQLPHIEVEELRAILMSWGICLVMKSLMRFWSLVESLERF